MREVTDNTFRQEIENKNLILVDFYATWCGPCKMQADVLEKINTSRSLKFDIIKVNVDESPKLAMEYEIESIPTLMVFKNNNLVKKIVGYVDEERLLNLMEEFED